MNRDKRLAQFELGANLFHKANTFTDDVARSETIGKARDVLKKLVASSTDKDSLYYEHVAWLARCYAETDDPKNAETQFSEVFRQKGPESELPEDPRPGQEQEPAAPPRKAKRVRPGGSARRAAPGVATARGLLDARRARAEEVDDEEERGAEEERHDEEACRRGKESGKVEPPGPRPGADGNECQLQQRLPNSST